MQGRADADVLDQRPTRRRLAAIAFLDVVGYSRMMGADEETTLRRWIAMRHGLIEPRVRAWHGRVVDRAGDGLFVEFQGALDAVRWAIDVQAAVASAAAEEPPMQVRVAVHLGDVLDGIDGGIHGDGVNTAARLQAFAEAGGIIATKAVVDEVAGKVAAPFVDQGELYLRNIMHPVHAFALRVGDSAVRRPAPVRGGPAEPRPSIAVLPFRKGHADPDDAYFADGIIEGIIHVLSGLEDLFVISSGATLGYAGATFDARAVGRELGVRYVLYGSVQRSGDRLRIGTELSDAESGAVIRSDRYDSQMAELFDLQDRISVQVATTIAPQLRERELARALRKHPESMTAYDFVLQGLDQLHRMDRGSFSRAHGLLRQAIEADPGYAPAYSYTAWWHIFRIAQGWSPDTAADSAEAARAAAEAIERNRSDALALAIQGYVTAYAAKDFGTAALLLDRAREVGPNCALAWAFSGALCCWMGDGPNAILRAERGLRLSPFGPFAFLHEHILSQAHHTNGTFEEAVLWGRRAAAHNPWHVPSFRTLAASMVAAGRRDEVCAISQRVLELEPSFSLRALAARTPLHGAERDAFIERLREAGLPD
jgi:TolB-like protein/class 3 adenylate cyclase